MRRVDGSAQKRLTTNGAPADGAPAYAPGGRQIAFDTNRDGNFEIYTMDADGKNQANLTNHPAADFTPDWQPLANKQR